MRTGGGLLSSLWLLPLFPLLVSSQSDPSGASEACKKELTACEEDLDCSNRLSPLMASCVTGTCQPQCRMAVLNLYQNRLGRALLRSDGTCIPGRDELRTCNFLPTGSQLHCSVAKLACESDLQCNSKLQVFESECEAETKRGDCSAKCRGLFSDVASTPLGTSFPSCTCTTRDDQLCEALKENLISPCVGGQPTPSPGDNTVTESSQDDSQSVCRASSLLLSAVLPLLLSR